MTATLPASPELTDEELARVGHSFPALTAVEQNNFAQRMLAELRRHRSSPSSAWELCGANCPQGQWLWTWREGEDKPSIAMLRIWPGPDGEAEWIAPDGRTTITHHTYLPPTHWAAPPILPEPPK